LEAVSLWLYTLKVVFVSWGSAEHSLALGFRSGSGGQSLFPMPFRGWSSSVLGSLKLDWLVWLTASLGFSSSTDFLFFWSFLYFIFFSHFPFFIMGDSRFVSLTWGLSFGTCHLQVGFPLDVKGGVLEESFPLLCLFGDVHIVVLVAP
jgi:hypothetical protein